MSVFCTKCNASGYDHVLDITGRHDDMTENEQPIFRSIFDKKGTRRLCGDCLDQLRSTGMSVEQVRNYLYLRE